MKTNDEKQLNTSENGNDGMGGGSHTVPNLKPDPMELPPLVPPVPNRAWTSLQKSKDVVDLTEEEKQGFFTAPNDII